jgi:hypothetical protein
MEVARSCQRLLALGINPYSVVTMDYSISLRVVKMNRQVLHYVL